jgi:ABC-2 type transport system permease protein
MRTIITSFIIECKKLKQTKIVSITIAIFVIMPLMLALLVFIINNPEVVGKSGLVNSKAAMFEENDWPGFLRVLIEAGAGLGLVGTGFVFAYIFGREYTDKTFKDLLAMPVSRVTIVFGKFLTAFVWSGLLFIVLYITGVIGGYTVGISGDENAIIVMGKSYFIQAVLIILISIPVALMASYGKGVIMPLGYVILTLFFSNLISTIGIGPLFPWTIPGLIGTGSSEQGSQVHLSGFIIFFLTVATGLYLTIQYWLRADHK